MNPALVCRTCMKEIAVQELINIFETRDCLMISAKIMSLTKLKIYPNDGLPSQICEQCVGKLDECVKFVQLCEKTDAQLRLLFPDDHEIESDTDFRKDDFLDEECLPLKDLKDELEAKAESLVFDVPIKQESDKISESEFKKAEIKEENDFLNNGTKEAKDEPNTQAVTKRKRGRPSKLTPIIDRNHKSKSKRSSALLNIEKKANIQKIKSQSSPTIKDEEEIKDEDSDIKPLKRKRGRPRTRPPGTKAKRIPKQCFICGKVMLGSHLRGHMRTHTGERPYSCDQCGKSFSEKGTLRQHLRRHTGEKPFVCTECGESFAQPAGLSAHQIKHTGERSYKCELCPKSYFSKTGLDYHLKSHACALEYSCEVCGRRFNAKANLKLHQITHSNEKPYACSECGKSFARKEHANRHSFNAHRILSCTQCPAKFDDKKTYAEHRKIHGYRDSSGKIMRNIDGIDDDNKIMSKYCPEEGESNGLLKNENEGGSNRYGQMDFIDSVSSNASL